MTRRELADMLDGLVGDPTLRPVVVRVTHAVIQEGRRMRQQEDFQDWRVAEVTQTDREVILHLEALPEWS